MRRPSRPALVVTAAGAVVTGLLAWAGQDLAGDGDPDTRAQAFVPPDGLRTVSEQDGRVRVDEHARLTGPGLLLTTPPEVAGALYAAADDDPLGWRTWRETTTTYDVAAQETGAQTTTVYRLTDRGTEQLASYGATSLVFDPPLLALPADVRDGDVWSSRGSATVDGSLDYDYEGRLTTRTGPGGDCVEVASSLTLTQDGEEVYDLEQPETWCPGRGSAVGEEEPAEPPAYDGSTRPQTPLAAGAEDWVAHPRPLVAAVLPELASPGQPPTQVALTTAPSGTGDGGLTVASTTTGDVMGFVRVEGALSRRWVGHPGGDVTAVTTAGDVSVVGTSRRELVAYGERGQWLWSAPTAGVPVAAPLAVDEDHLVGVDVAGGVVDLDPATGEQRWDATLTDQVRLSPVSDGEVAVVADVAGHVAALDLDDGVERWSTDLPRAVALAVVGDAVVVQAGESTVALALDDGTRRWSARVGQDGGLAVAELGRTVAVADDEDTVGLDRATGEVRWRRPGADASLGLDSRLVQVRDDELTVRDDDGGLLARLDLEGLVLAPGAPPYLAAADAGVWVSDADGRVLEVSP